MTPTVDECGGDVVHVERACGVLRMSHSGLCVYNYVEGYFDQTLALAMLDNGDERIRQQGTIHIFCDWGRMTGYARNVRRLCTHWGVQNRSRVLGYHMLTKDNLVRTAVQMAGFVLDSVQHYEAQHALQASFERLSREAQPSGLTA